MSVAIHKNLKRCIKNGILRTLFRYLHITRKALIIANAESENIPKKTEREIFAALKNAKM